MIVRELFQTCLLNALGENINNVKFLAAIAITEFNRTSHDNSQRHRPSKTLGTPWLDL